MFGWGRNDQGQLGLGGGLTMDVYAAEVLPRSIEALAGEKVPVRVLNANIFVVVNVVVVVVVVVAVVVIVCVDAIAVVVAAAASAKAKANARGLHRCLRV